MRKVIIFVDGMFMRRRVFERKCFYYSAKEIRNYCLKHLKQDDYLVRMYYYDCLPLRAKGISPLNNREIRFAELESAKQRYMLIDALKSTPQLALRLGYMEWNGRDWAIVGAKVAPLLRQKIQLSELSDADIRPNSESTQIDVKMALDMTVLASRKAAELFVLITDRSDLIPAIEMVRLEGVQLCLDAMYAPISSELAAEVDFRSTYVPGQAEHKTQPRHPDASQ